MEIRTVGQGVGSNKEVARDMDDFQIKVCEVK